MATTSFKESLLAGLGDVASKSAVTPATATRATAPGMHMQAQLEVQALRRQIEELEKNGSGHPMRLDANDIVLTPLANRIEESFLSQDFLDLKQQIASTKGNVQSVGVTRLPNGKWALIFGHRRHRACRDLGYKVNAMAIEGEVSEMTMFLLMNAENKERKDPSPYEQGLWYINALERNVFPSARAMAEASGTSHVWISKCMKVAKLPREVITCFTSPLEITSKAAEAIGEALEKTPDDVMLRAAVINERSEKLPAAQVVSHLLFDDGETRAEKPRPLSRGKVKYGSVKRDGKGRAVLVLSSDFNRKDLQAVLAKVAEIADQKPSFAEKPKKAAAAKSKAPAEGEQK